MKRKMRPAQGQLEPAPMWGAGHRWQKTTMAARSMLEKAQRSLQKGSSRNFDRCVDRRCASQADKSQAEAARR